jgi:predicted MFS family arabinose efflux permease
MKKKAITLLLVEFFYELNFFSLVFSLLLKEAGISLTNISLVFVIRSCSKMALEFPSGMIGDLLGRKRIVLIGLGISSISYILYLNISPIYFFYIVIIEMVGYTLISGALDAMFYEAIPEGMEEKYSALYSLFYRISIAISAILTGIIAHAYGYSTSFLISSMTCIIAFVMLVFVKDDTADKYSSSNPLKCLRYVFKTKAVFYFICLGILIDIVHIPLQNYYSLLLDSMGFNQATIGIVYSIGLIFGAFASFTFIPYLKKRLSSIKMILIIPLTLLIADLVFVYSTGILAIIFSVLSMLLASMYAAYRFSLLNKSISNTFRASVLSFVSLSIGFSGIISNYAYGTLSTHFGTTHALGIIILCSVALYIVLNIFLHPRGSLQLETSNMNENF